LGETICLYPCLCCPADPACRVLFGPQVAAEPARAAQAVGLAVAELVEMPAALEGLEAEAAAPVVVASVDRGPFDGCHFGDRAAAAAEPEAELAVPLEDSAALAVDLAPVADHSGDRLAAAGLPRAAAAAVALVVAPVEVGRLAGRDRSACHSETAVELQLVAAAGVAARPEAGRPAGRDPSADRLVAGSPAAAESLRAAQAVAPAEEPGVAQ